jgi:tetratricopeptide (TPR) repeat protein
MFGSSATRPQIRVFVSSTFRDMQAEREELVKQTFPQLRRLCAQRGVEWGEVDLRWGITDEQARRGEVLPICLAEIDRCRPFFIALLGERYGWVPEQLDPEVLAAHPWLAEHPGCSVMEYEILHGALRQQRRETTALFYFRASAYPGEPSLFLEVPTAEEITRYGSAEAERRAASRRCRLADLKTRIRQSGFPIRDNYQGPPHLGELVLRDLTAILDERFPSEKVVPLHPLDREAAEHEAFAASRARVYVGRPEYFDQLDAHVAGSGSPLVVLGESGGGKSALLANWARRYESQPPAAAEPPENSLWGRLTGWFRGEASPATPAPPSDQPLLLLHFVGASPASADYTVMLRRILGELKRRFQIPHDVPDRPAALRDAFRNWLHLAAAQGRMILVLDALNQLEDRDGAPDLVWLPSDIPDNIRLILTTLPGRPLDELRRRGWPTLTVEPLHESERRQLIVDYLRHSGKALTESRTTAIAAAPQTANPLYLRALLEELRVFGMHERVDALIEHYLEAGSIPELYERILGRYEEDYEHDRPGLVRDAMTALWVARRGLAEDELMYVLGSFDLPCPRAFWSPLYLAAEESLVNRSGRISFFHEGLRNAVRNRYLPTPEAQTEAHRHFADFCATAELNDRKLEEYPWQLARAGEWRRLFALLSDLPFFARARKASEFDVREYWAQVQENSPLRIVDAYRPVLERPEDHAGFVRDVAETLFEAQHFPESLKLWEWRVDRLREQPSSTALTDGLFHLARTLRRCGQLDRAIELLGEAEVILLQGNEKGRLADILRAQGIGYDVQGDWPRALELYRKAAALSREAREPYGLMSCLGNEARILGKQGDWASEFEMLREVERLARELGAIEELTKALVGEAEALLHLERPDEALRVLQEAVSLRRRLGDPVALVESLKQQAELLAQRGEHDLARERYVEIVQVQRRVNDVVGLIRAIEDVAQFESSHGTPARAFDWYAEAVRLCRDTDRRQNLAACLVHRAALQYEQRDLVGCLAGMREAADIMTELQNRQALEPVLSAIVEVEKELGNPDAALTVLDQLTRLSQETSDQPALRKTLHERALIHKEREEFDQALELLLEEEQLCDELGLVDELQNCLITQGNIHYARGDLDQALALYKRQEKTCRDADLPDGLQRALGNQVLIFLARAELESALSLGLEREQICRMLGNDGFLRRSLSDLATVRTGRGEIDAALACRREEADICRRLNQPDNLQACLIAWGNLFFDRKDFDAALPLYREAEEVCRSAQLRDRLPATLHNQALIHRARGDTDEALRLLREQEEIARELGRVDDWQWSLCEQGNIHYDRKDYDAALPLYQQQERICRDAGLQEGLRTSLYYQTLIRKARGEIDEALRLLAEQAELCRELKSPDKLQLCLVDRGNLLYDRRDFEPALACYREAEQVCRAAGLKEPLRIALYNQTLIHKARGEMDEALRLLDEQCDLCRELGQPERLQLALEERAGILLARRAFADALKLYREQEQICRDLDLKESLARALYAQGFLLRLRGDAADSGDALRLLEEQCELCRELDLGNLRQLGLGERGLLHLSRGEQDEALARFEEQEQVCSRDANLVDGLQRSLGNQALIHRLQGRLERARELLAVQEHLCRDSENSVGLQFCLHQQGEVALAAGEHETALRLFEEEGSLCRELGLLDALLLNVNSRVSILSKYGAMERALPLYWEQAELCRRLGNQEGLQAALHNQARVLYARGDRDETLALLHEVEEILHRLGNRKGLEACLRDQAIVHQARGDLDQALALLQRQEGLLRESIVSADAGTPVTERVHFSAFAPPAVEPGSRYLLSIWAFLEDQREVLQARAGRQGRFQEVGSKGPVRVPRGTEITVVLDLPDFRVADPTDTLLWEGELASASFAVDTPLDIHPGTHLGKARIFCAGIPIARLDFAIEVGREQGEPQPLRTQEQRVRSVFASYASEDRPAVLQWTRGARLAGVEVFVDVLSLREGANWEEELQNQVPSKDLFCLFWSEPASRSRWVEMEWRCALAARGLDYIQPVPLVDPREVPPPKELSSRHFDDLLRIAATYEETFRTTIPGDPAAIPPARDELEMLQAALNNQARILHSRGRFDEALVKYREQEQVCRQHGLRGGLQSALDGMVVILEAQRRWDDALRLAKEWEALCRELNHAAGLPRALFSRAAAHRGRSEFDKALQAYRELEQLCKPEPANNVLLLCLHDQATLLHYLGRLPEALASAQKAAACARQLGDPVATAGVLNTMAALLQALGRLDEALAVGLEQQELYQRAGRPDGVQQALGNRAGVHFARGEYDIAEGLYAEQERLARDRQDAAGIANALYARGECARVQSHWDHALELYNDALALNPDLALAYQMRGQVHGQRYAWAQAIADYSRGLACALRQGIDIVPLLLSRAWAYYEAGQDESALADYEQAAACQPANASVFTDWGIVLSNLGRLDEALEKCTRAIALAPTVSTAFEARAFARGYRGDYTAALDDANRAIELNDRQANHFDVRAWVRMRLSDWRGSAEDCARTLALDQAHPYAYSSLALARWGLGQVEATLEALRQVLALQLREFTLTAPRRGRLHCLAWGTVVKDWDWSVELQKRPDPLAKLGRGIAFWMAGELAPAVKDFEEASRRDPRLREDAERILELVRNEQKTAAGSPAE